MHSTAHMCSRVCVCAFVSSTLVLFLLAIAFAFNSHHPLFCCVLLYALPIFSEIIFFNSFFCVPFAVSVNGFMNIVKVFLRSLALSMFWCLAPPPCLFNQHSISSSIFWELWYFVLFELEPLSSAAAEYTHHHMCIHTIQLENWLHIQKMKKFK